MFKQVVWLWCMWRLYREYHRDGLCFSARVALLQAARPPLPGNIHIAHPDALFHITPGDMRRAMEISRDPIRRRAFV